MENIDRSIRTLQAMAKQRDATFATEAAPVAGGSRNLSMSWKIGARVLDTVTGQTGTVVNGKLESVIIPLAGSDGGGDGVRTP